MLSFMVQEGILTIGTVSGIFTALLLNSIKNNIQQDRRKIYSKQ